MARVLIRPGVAALLLAFATASAFADADRGSESFDSNCAECHSVASKLKNKKGPTLFGVVGRKAGSVSGYEYSDGMKAVDFTWDRDRLDAYITAPRKVVPGGKMKFDGLDDAKERADLLDFLAQQR